MTVQKAPPTERTVPEVLGRTSREEARLVEPWQDVRQQLPRYLLLTLTAKYVELSCSRCKEFVLIVRRERATREQILEAARSHQCPQGGGN